MKMIIFHSIFSLQLIPPSVSTEKRDLWSHELTVRTTPTAPTKSIILQLLEPGPI